jgi:hypothetical protein
METKFGEVTRVFVDRAKSGKDTNRPELQRLLKAIVNREISIVMVTELSRLSRSIKDFADMWETMRAYANVDSTTADQFPWDMPKTPRKRATYALNLKMQKSSVMFSLHFSKQELS